MSEIPVERPIYQFSFTSDEYITYTVYFLNEKAAREDATDHAAPHCLRRDFITEIMKGIDRSALQNIWFPLPDHEFSSFLKNKNFDYSRWMFQTEDDHCWIYIE